MNDINSLAHSKWRCQYHIVFAPKYRRQEVYGKIKADIGQILRKLRQFEIQIRESSLLVQRVLHRYSWAE